MSKKTALTDTVLNYFPFDFLTAPFTFLFEVLLAGLDGAGFVLEAAGFAAFGLAAAFAFFAADECLGFEGETIGAGALSIFGVTAAGASGGADCAGTAIACCQPGVNISNRSRETEFARRQRGQYAS
ncbi:MAG: hypothetical protein HY022_10405 [Chloroflexi bacterium]|nr:hypothetical protein [Chloroflexota bacterium]